MSSKFGYTGTHITGTGLVHTGACVLERITFNAPTAGSAGTLTVYDGTDNTGTVVAIIGLSTSTYRGALEYGIKMATGIYVVLATSTGLDCTVVNS